MNRRNSFSIWIGVLVLAGMTVFASTALAGPPLICWPFDIGNAKSLPWGDGTRGWNTPQSSYNVSGLTRDTVALLTPGTPVIVRMETLRRATIYASKNASVADELLTALQTRAQEAEAKGHPDALAWFDVGYLAEAYKQMALIDRLQLATPALDGYKQVSRAIHLRGGDAEMEFAAALMSAEKTIQAQRDNHWRNAVAGATDGSLLATNLVTHCQVVGLRATAMAELRAQSGSVKK